MGGELLKVKCLNTKTKVEAKFVLDQEMKIGQFLHENKLREFLFTFSETSFVNNLFYGTDYLPKVAKKHSFDDIGTIHRIVHGIVRYKWFKIIQPNDIDLFPHITAKYPETLEKIDIRSIHEYNQANAILKTVETLKHLQFDKIYLSFYDSRTDDIGNLEADDFNY